MMSAISVLQVFLTFAKVIIPGIETVRQNVASIKFFTLQGPP